jgi:N-acetylglucosamine-6-phosphate deacetylase
MASETPAGALGLTDRGRLAPGSRADLCLFDDALQVTGTVIAGTLFR